jgi:hypothetical protein
MKSILIAFALIGTIGTAPARAATCQDLRTKNTAECQTAGAWGPPQSPTSDPPDPPDHPGPPSRSHCISRRPKARLERAGKAGADVAPSAIVPTIIKRPHRQRSAPYSDVIIRGARGG